MNGSTMLRKAGNGSKECIAEQWKIYPMACSDDYNRWGYQRSVIEESLYPGLDNDIFLLNC